MTDRAGTIGSGESHRVLVVSADMGSGHNATAAALTEDIDRRWPGSSVRRVDALDLMGVGPLFRRIYVGNVEHTPWLYEFFYASLWRHRWFAEASKRFTGTWCGRRLVPILDEFDPDLVVSTYPLGSSGLAWLRRHRGLSVPTAAWVSDFSPHPFWVYRDLDLNVVLHEVAAVTARAAEPQARVVVGPPPVVAAFCTGETGLTSEPNPAVPSPSTRPTTPSAPANPDPDRLKVLLSCGSYSFGDTLGLVRSVVTGCPDVELIAVCGRDAQTHRALLDLNCPAERLRVLGWVDDMPSLVRQVDLMLTNAGGATALEALASGVPVVMFEPIAAHGRANADLMVISGLADLVGDADRLADYLTATVRDRAALRGLRDRTLAHLRRPDLADGLGLLAESRPHQDTPVRRAWPIRPTDALFAAVETDDVPQEVGVVCQLGAGPDGRVPSLDALRLELAARARLLPALHRRLAGTGRLGWITDTDLDMDRQVGEWVLSTDSGSPEARLEMAMTAVGRFWSQRLPRDRPAFQVQLIRAEHGPLREGATGSPAVAALVAFKMHHAVADGISALSLLDRLLTRPSGLDRASSSGPTSESGSAASTARAAVTGLVSLAAQGLAPPQPLSRPPSRDRQVVGWTVSLAEVTARSSALGVRRHEFVLGLIAEALGRLLRPAALVRDGSSLRAMVPVAIRPARLDRFFGNWTGTLAVDLPVEPMPFSTRVDLLAREMRTRASRGEPLASHLVLRAAGRLPRRLFAAAARAVYGARFFHTIVSYLPGPREERFLAGARVGAIYPVLPLAPGVPITVATVTFDSTLGVGVTVDSGLGVDPDTVRAAWDQAWAATDGQPAGAPVSAAPTGS